MLKSFYLFLLLVVVAAFSFKPSENVLICKSPTSYAYHSKYCQGLKKCTHDVIEVPIEEALEKYGKNKACGYCY